MTDLAKGYILHTGSATADPNQFQQLVTIDAPTQGDVIHATHGRQGTYFLSKTKEIDGFTFTTHVLPTPDNKTDVRYANAAKMDYIWKSKKFVMPGWTTMAAAKVQHAGGCVRLRVYADGCLACDIVVGDCRPFKLPAQVAGTTFEIELRGTSQVSEAHIAQSMRELLENG